MVKILTRRTCFVHHVVLYALTLTDMQNNNFRLKIFLLEWLLGIVLINVERLRPSFRNFLTNVIESLKFTSSALTDCSRKELCPCNEYLKGSFFGE